MFERNRPIAHDEDAVSECDRLVDVMRHQQNAWLVLGNQFAYEIMHADARQRVERGEWLIQQQKFRFLHQCPGECDALSLSAGEIARPVIKTFAETDLGKRGSRPRSRVRRGEPERNISPKIIPWQQPMFLEDHGRPPRRCDASALDRVETGERPQQRGLAAAAFSEQRDELAAFDPQAKISDDDAIFVGAAKVAYRHGWRLDL
jgi:hypothetical protein